MNVTLPVAAEGDTVAVKVTGDCAGEGFSDDVSSSDVSDLVPDAPAYKSAGKSARKIINAIFLFGGIGDSFLLNLEYGAMVHPSRGFATATLIWVSIRPMVLRCLVCLWPGDGGGLRPSLFRRAFDLLTRFANLVAGWAVWDELEVTVDILQDRGLIVQR